MKMFSTVYISSSSIKLMTVDRNEVSKWAVRLLEPGLVRDGKILDPLKVGGVIDNLFQSVAASKNNVTLTISGLPYTYRSMDFPKMKPDQIRDAMNYNAPAEFTVPAESLYMSWAPVNIKRETVEYFVIGVNRQFIEAIIETVNFAGITNWSLDIKPLALARAAAQSEAIIVSLDYDYMDMVMVRDGKIREIHSANVDMDANDFNRGEYIGLFAAELQKLISYHFNNDKNDTQNNAMPIVFTGETLGSFLENTDSQTLLQELNTATGYPVEFLKTSLPGPTDFVAEPYAVNIGLALRRFKNKAKEAGGFHDINLDLMLGEFEKKPQTLSLGYIIIPAVLVMIVGIITAITGANNQIKADVTGLQLQLDKANQSLIAMRSAQAKATDLQKQLDAAAAQLQAAKAEHQALLGNKGSNTPDMTLVIESFPPKSDFRTVSIDENQIRVTGIVSNPFDVITYFRSLENSGFNGVNIYYIGDQDTEGNYPFTILINQTVNITNSGKN
jgi:Tfp pilus assembly PilM family ATPase